MKPDILAPLGGLALTLISGVLGGVASTIGIGVGTLLYAVAYTIEDVPTGAALYIAGAVACTVVPAILVALGVPS